MFEVDNTGKLVFLYGRTSSDDQAERDTIADQVFFYERWCEMYGHRDGGQYLDDGVTGTLPFLERPEGARLVADIRSGKVKHVVFKNVKRLGRSIRSVLGFIDIAEESGATIQSLTEPFDTATPIGKFIVTLLAGISELDREAILEQTRSGKRRKARRGEWVTGRVAYGMRLGGTRHRMRIEGADDTPVPEFSEEATRASVIVWIFTQIAARSRSAEAIKEYLNVLHVPSPIGGVWHTGTICTIIRNPIYKGLQRYGAKKDSILPLSFNEVPGIVSPELWQRANDALTANRNMSRSGTNRRYLLRGVMFCADCGAPYSGMVIPGYGEIADATDHRRGIIYRSRCKIRKEHACPGGKSISGEVEHFVWESIRTRVNGKDSIPDCDDTEADEWEQTAKRLRTEMNRLDAEIAGKDKERHFVLRMARRERISETEADAQIDEIKAEAEILRTDRERLQQDLDALSDSVQRARDVTIAIQKIRDQMENQPGPYLWEEKRAIIEMLIARILISTVKEENGGIVAEARIKFR